MTRTVLPASQQSPAQQSEDFPPAPPKAQGRPSRWHLVTDVFVPFALSRILLGCAAWLFADQPRGSACAAELAKRSSAITPVRWLEVWARWDTSWYVQIATHGYTLDGYTTGTSSSIAFFPLFPQTIRMLHRALPLGWQSTQAALVLGLLLANLCALAALSLLYAHVRERFGERATAMRAVAFLLAFPTAFYLSCCYTESMFLLLALASYHAAWKQRWATASVLGALLSATRPTGVLMLLPLLWMNLAAADLKLARVGARVGWLALVPAGFLAYALYLWHWTGDALAVFKAQAAWSRHLASPLALFNVPPYFNLLHPDRALTLAFSVLALWLVTRRAWRDDGLLVCALLVAFIFSGTSLSAARFLLVAFPAFVWLASLRSQALHLAYVGAAVMTQTAMWGAWVLMHWVA